MNTSFRKVRAAIGIACFLVAVCMSVLGAGGGSGVSGSNNSSAFASFPPPAAPFESWSTPQNFTNNGQAYDIPWIGAASTGAVTIGWERRDGSGTYVEQTSNTSQSGSFRGPQELNIGGVSDTDRNIRVAADSLGRRWEVWWAYDGTNACNYFARVDTDGIAHLTGTITCIDRGSARKNIALAVGTDNNVYVLLGRNLENIYYYQMDSNGQLVVQNEPVTSGSVKNITIGVTTAGQVIASWVDTTSSSIRYSLRQGANNWTTPTSLSDIPVCGGSPHLPTLARDSSGGMRIVWSQVQCPITDPTNDEVYYREWTAANGWGSTSAYYNPSHQDDGNSYQPVLTVDASGIAYILWMDDSGRPSGSGNFQIYYSKGRLSSGFTDYGAIYNSYFGNSYQKDPSIAYSSDNAYLHATARSNKGGSGNDYYSTAPVIGGITPTPTPVPCTPGVYTDVSPSAYYATPVYVLGRDAVMNGYGDCTFRPNNTISRGQTAKIIVLGASLPITLTGGPHFSDVHTDNAFYDYIETAYNTHQIISGYSDGTFRPTDNVTRAQFSKMVVLAFQFPINTTNGPHFSDVPNSSALYQFVETAYNRGLISGYTGGVFRPNDYISRGQAAKIVYLARPH